MYSKEEQEKKVYKYNNIRAIVTFIMIISIPPFIFGSIYYLEKNMKTIIIPNEYRNKQSTEMINHLLLFTVAALLHKFYPILTETKCNED
jgi:hypothetical protein